MNTSLRTPGAVCVIVTALLSAGCGVGEDPAKVTVMEVSLAAPDGATIEADVSGDGSVGLVLAHGMRYLDGKESFRRELEYFGSRGLRALALSFRGYPAEKVPPLDPDRTLDLVAAVRHLREAGCERVFVLGSSMGGALALAAAPRLSDEPGFAGLIVVSAGGVGAADEISCPKLLVWARDDRMAAPAMEAMYATAPEPKDYLTLDRGGHGQRLFESQGRHLRRVILTFVRDAAQRP
jgi:pimeloyl-ACP methyl ester carboxylesterase